MREVECTACVDMKQLVENKSIRQSKDWCPKKSILVLCLFEECLSYRRSPSISHMVNISWVDLKLVKPIRNGFNGLFKLIVCFPSFLFIKSKWQVTKNMEKDLFVTFIDSGNGKKILKIFVKVLKFLLTLVKFSTSFDVKSIYSSSILIHLSIKDHLRT